MKNAAVIALACSLLAATTASASAWEQIRNSRYEVVGFLDPQPGDRVFVRDCRGRIIGYTMSLGTFEQNGNRKVSSQQIPTILLGKKVPGCPSFETGGNRGP